MTSRLQRFKDAQNQTTSGYETALAELRAGAKRSHWIWYVFPQLAGMGSSAASRTYALAGIAEAEEFLRDPLLRARLLTIAGVVAEHIGRGRRVALSQLMGSSIDVTKLVSSMTLFAGVATRLHETENLEDYAAITRVAEKILAVAAVEGYPPCQFTLRHFR